MKKKAAAEARASELDNLQKVADGWEKLCNERQEANTEKDRIIAEKDAKIDALYMQIGEIRHERDEQIEENTKLRVQIAANTPKICERRGCPDREPQSGY
ncbi:MAG: hypothetical protein IJ745_02565 [Bacteroidales bacterium]|nr:hypothetical protein [Bacteroidales bacterium]